MKEAEFNKEYNNIINHIAETIEQNDPQGDIDVDLNADILTFITSNGTYVINKQSSVCEIWLSSPVSGPYHFSISDTKWLTKGGDDLFKVLSNDLGFAIVNR